MNKVNELMKGLKESWVREKYFEKTGQPIAYKRLLAIRKNQAQPTLIEANGLVAALELENIESLIA